jgi:hypothetical protein
MLNDRKSRNIKGRKSERETDGFLMKVQQIHCVPHPRTLRDESSPIRWIDLSFHAARINLRHLLHGSSAKEQDTILKHLDSSNSRECVCHSGEHSVLGIAERSARSSTTCQSPRPSLKDGGDALIQQSQ